jgi:hypothetical protein
MRLLWRGILSFGLAASLQMTRRAQGHSARAYGSMRRVRTHLEVKRHYRHETEGLYARGSLRVHKMGE